MKSEEFSENKSRSLYISFVLMTTVPESNNRSCRLLNTYSFCDRLWLVCFCWRKLKSARIEGFDCATRLPVMMGLVPNKLA
jgi:hypothetical protein